MKIPDNTPDEIQQLSQRCTAHVKNRLGFEPDFTIDTISALDHFINQVVEEESRGLTPLPGDPARAHLVELLAPTLGAYLGVVLASTFGARWRHTGSDPRDWRLEFEQFFLCLNPAGAAANAISMEPVEAFGGTVTTSPALTPHLIERLEAAPPIPEDEFFSLAALVEVIQIAEEYLKERAAKDGGMDCSESSYDAVFRTDD